MKHLRYGHNDGHTDVSYNNLFKDYFASCGSEGDVRVWKGINDVDQKDVCVGDRAWALYCKGSRLFVGTDTFLIQAFTFPEMEVDGIITRFTSSVTQIDVSENGQILAAGSCDMDIHVVDLDSLDRKVLIGHKGPVLSVSLHPNKKLLASSSCDGTVRIWDLESGLVTKQWNCVDKSNSFESAPSVCRIHFQPSGKLLAVPSSTGINIYEFDDDSSLSKTETLFPDCDKYLSVGKFSNCGNFLAGGSVKGNLYVWDVSSYKLVGKSIYNNDVSITAISWHCSSKSLVFCNKAGQLGELTIPTEAEFPDTNGLADIPLGEPVFDQDDDDDENIISLEKIKAQSTYSDVPADKADGDFDLAEVESVSSVHMTKQLPLSTLQETFQPSSTPTHLQQRFMVWNKVGIVKQFNNDDFEEIDVEFHDSSVHHGFRLSNSAGYSMVALTEQVLILASSKKVDKPSKLYCILLKAWDSQREWEFVLENEDIIAVAGGHNFVAVITDLMMLRIYSIEGTQTDVHSIPGPLITFVGCQDLLAYYYHSGQGCNQESFVSFALMKIDAKTKIAYLICNQQLPLSPTSNIRWTGFSDEGSAATLDSEGVVRLLYKRNWRPICCLEKRNKGKFDHYFVIGLSERTHTIRSILCKGSYYPPVLPKPIVSELKWQMPLFGLGEEKSDLEEELLRNVITVTNLEDIFESPDDFMDEDKKAMEKTISVTIMKLFSLACRAGLDGKALSLCESMPSVDIIMLASKYAAKLGRIQLANRVSAVLAQKMAKMNETPSEPETRRMQQETFERPSTPSSNNGSQDLFEDLDPSSANTSKENLILKMRKKKADLVKPALIKRFSNNPFKVASPASSDLESNDKANFMNWFNENKPLLKEENPLMGPSELAVFGMKKFKQHKTTSPKKMPCEEKESETSTSTEQDIFQTSSTEPVDTKKRKNSDFSESSNKRPLTSVSSKLKSFSFQKKS